MRVRAPLLLLAVGACVPRAAAPPPAPLPVATAVPPPAPPIADWRDRPQTPGSWTYRQDARGSLALFGRPGADAVLTLRCDRAARLLYLSRGGADATALTVRTTSLTRTLPASPTGGTPPFLAATLAADDPLLDAMAFSRGRFAVEGGGAALAVPAWAEIGRTTQDCRG